MSMTPRAWLIPALAGILGLAVGVLIAGGLSPAAVVSTASESPAPPEAVSPGSANPAAAFTLEDVRRVVREELDLRASAPANANARDDARAVKEAPTPIQISKALEARAVLDSAIAKRTWTEVDSEALREKFSALAPDQQAALLEAYAAAVNQGRLVPQTDRAPF